ncbi:MAG: hypothetical protein ACM3ZC_04840 [Bacteroidota bacterium]
MRKLLSFAALIIASVAMVTGCGASRPAAMSDQDKAEALTAILGVSATAKASDKAMADQISQASGRGSRAIGLWVDIKLGGTWSGPDANGWYTYSSWPDSLGFSLKVAKYETATGTRYVYRSELIIAELRIGSYAELNLSNAGFPTDGYFKWECANGSHVLIGFRLVFDDLALTPIADASFAASHNWYNVLEGTCEYYLTFQDGDDLIEPGEVVNQLSAEY